MARGDITITLSTFIAHYLFMASAVHVFLQMDKILQIFLFQGFSTPFGYWRAVSQIGYHFTCELTKA